METQSLSLSERWRLLREKNPKLRTRNAATTLGVTEAQLLATGCGGGHVVRLSVSWRDFLPKELPTLGLVRAITRNEHVVHERMGLYKNPSFKEAHPVGLFVGEDIDLRLFLHHWCVAFSVTDGEAEKKQHSLQFFDHHGTALHKIYLTEQSNLQSFLRITDAYKAENQSSIQPSTESKSRAHGVGRDEKSPNPLDVNSFQAAWLQLRDTHDFHLLLRRFSLSRLEALRHAPAACADAPSRRHALRVRNTAFRVVLTEAAASGLPIMVFVGNEGMLQIHTGCVEKLLDTKEWFNILDPHFNLHVREAAIHQSWIVRKPTEDGTVSSLEIFDEKGALLCTLFGKRKPGIKEDLRWRSILDALEGTHADTAS